MVFKDYFLQYENFYNRLKADYEKHKELIIAFDYDYTIYAFRGEDYTFNDVINTLKRWKNHASFILYSASDRIRYPDMLRYCNELGLRVDAINENVPGIIGSDGGKVYYNVFLDDRAGLLWPVMALNELMDEIEGKSKDTKRWVPVELNHTCEITKVFDKYSDFGSRNGGKAFLTEFESIKNTIAIRALGATRGSIIVNEDRVIQEIMLDNNCISDKIGIMDKEKLEELKEEMKKFKGCLLGKINKHNR